MPRQPAKKKKPAKKSARKSAPTTPEPGSLVPAGNGGMIRYGSKKGNTPGTGRPPDEIRAAMRELGVAKGLPFLDGVLDGKVEVGFIGTCPHCGKESEPDTTWMKDLTDKVKASVDQRLKATEQAWKYGLGTKEEITLVSPDVQSRLARQVSVILSRPTWVSEELLTALDEVWS